MGSKDDQGSSYHVIYSHLANKRVCSFIRQVRVLEHLDSLDDLIVFILHTYMKIFTFSTVKKD
jgi:hypothetical protein